MSNDDASKTDLEPETQPLDEQHRIVSADENSAGAVEFDDLGQPRWKWITEMQSPEVSEENTFNYLKALSNEDLTLAEESSPEAPATDAGYDPYDTVRLKIDKRFRKR